MQPVRDERDLDQLRRATRVWAVLSAWVETGVIDALSDGEPRRIGDLPGDPRALSITAALLAHMGLLVAVRDAPDFADQEWMLSAAARKLLAAGALTHLALSLPELARLPDVLRDGGPVPDEHGSRTPTRGGVSTTDPEAGARFLNNLYRRAAEPAAETARIIASRSPVGTALDLGGGHGRYAEALLSRGFQVTLLDQPAVLPLARARHGDSLSYRAGDFESESFGIDVAGGPYDVVLLSNIAHSVSGPDLQRLFGRLREIVRPGGLLVLKDMFIDDTGVGPEPAVAFGLMMLMYSPRGQSWAAHTLRDWLATAGFAQVEHVGFTDLEFSLLICR